MKKIVEKEIEICDVCKKEEAWKYCRICGKNFCDNCEKDAGKQLYSELGIESSDDVFCNDCINKYKDLFDLYREMGEIRESRIRRYEEETRKAIEITKKIREARSLLVSTL